jgi:hypothetical protein
MKKLLLIGGLVVTLGLVAGGSGGAAASAAPALPVIGGLYSPSHPLPAHWYNTREARFAWSPPLGVGGYSYVFDQSPITTPDTTLDSTVRSFAERTNYATGSRPYSVAVADFNGDGRQDLVTANIYADNVSVLLGNGDGSFAAKMDYTTGAAPVSVTAADFNGDGNQDLATANSSGDSVSALLGNGDGTFATKTDYAIGLGVESVAAADLNGDGKQDLVTANWSASTVSVLLGNGDGTFTAKTNYPTDLRPNSVAVADFNGDGNQDLVTANSTTPTTGNIIADNVSVLLGNGDGSFAAKTDYTTGFGPESVVAADFNGDGNQDLATANIADFSVSVLLGNGDGSFAAKTDYATWRAPCSVSVADFNGDGKQDLVTANFSGGNVSVLLGNGDGSFAAMAKYPTGGSPRSVATADFNDDGKQDLATANLVDASVSVLLNAPGATETANADGLWYFHVCAVDGLGGSGATATRAVRVDTRKPTPIANWAASALPNHIASLRYMIADPRPGSPTANVTIKVRNHAGTLMKTLTYKDRQVGTANTAKFAVPYTWKAGTYMFYVFATDQAGNRQAKIASNRLIVR